MRLQKITLNNFRCFESLSLELHPRLTVLVAENGGGKTAILDGIAIGLSPVLRYLSSADQRLTGPGITDTDFRLETIAGPRGGDRLVTSVFSQIIMETSDPDGLTWDNWRASSKGKHPEAKVGQKNLAAYAAKVLDSLKTVEPKLLPVFAYYGTRRGLLAIPKRLRGAKVEYTQPTAALVGALDSFSDFTEMLNWFDVEESAELRANKGCAPENFEESDALHVVREVISAILGGEYSNPYFNKKHKFVIESRTGPGLLQVSQLSQGYQSMLALGMDFARRMALANSGWLEHVTHEYFKDNLATFHPSFGGSSAVVTPQTLAPAIMLVDEIDLHLHPSWQQRVLDDLMRAFPHTQFIVTTHSPQVLTTVPKECIRLLQSEWDEGAGQTRISVKTVEQQTEGLASSDVLAAVMGTDPVPPIEKAAWLSEYRGLIQQGLQDSPRGDELKQKLIDHFGPHHPEILECERLIRLEIFKRKLPPLGENIDSGKKG